LSTIYYERCSRLALPLVAYTCGYRLELTEQAESTLREALDRERERADAERERAEKLQAELDRARLPWWRKMFGS
jgi:hypothetical protein